MSNLYVLLMLLSLCTKQSFIDTRGGRYHCIQELDNLRNCFFSAQRQVMEYDLFQVININLKKKKKGDETEKASRIGVRDGRWDI